MQQVPPGAAAAAAPQEVNMEEAWATFRAGVTSVFKQWMTLYLAVTGGWGGGDCYRKADLFLEEVLKMYQPNPRAGLRPRAPEKDAVADCLQGYLFDHLGVTFDDDEPEVEEVTALLDTMWEHCVRGDYTLAREVVGREAQVLRLQHRFSEVSRSVSQQAQAAQPRDDEMDDSDSEDVEEDEGGMGAGMGPPRPATARATAGFALGGGEMEMEVQGEGGMAQEEDEEEEEPPAVDEDGWTTVRTTRRRNPRRGGQQQPRAPSLFR